MRRLRCSLATVMFAVVLSAADLATLRHVLGPVEDGIPLNLILSLLPMANVAAIVGYRLIRAPRSRRPFALGFLTCGLAAMAAHAACDQFIPAVMESAYAWPFRAAVNFCRTHQVSGYVAPAPGGGVYFRYYPALAAVFCLPQFLVAVCGGTAFGLWTGRLITTSPNEVLQRTRYAGRRSGSPGRGEVNVGMAYHLVTERKIEGLDASACVKALDRAESLGDVADRVGVLPLSVFFSDDWAAPAVYAKLFEDAGIQPPEVGFPATRWFSAEDGLVWVRSLLSYLAGHPTAVSDSTALITDLRDFESIFGRLASEGIRWHLGIADPDDERIGREQEAKLNRMQPEELDELLHGESGEVGAD